MKTAVAITPEIDDVELAVKELASQIREKLQLERNSIGIAYCDADMDVARLGELLRTELGIDIIGLTTIAAIERHTGYNDMGVLLSVLTADDVTFSIGSTGRLDSDSFPDVIRKTYAKTRAEISDDPKLILALAPYIEGISSDHYVEILDEVSGSVPVFGGVATDHFDLKHQRTFYNGQEYSRGLVFLLFAGNIKPIFSMKHNFNLIGEKRGVITKTTRNLVEKVNDKTFKEFVVSMVPVSDETNVAFIFHSTPFVMELPDYEKNEPPVLRALCTIDHETGTGGFLSKMPKGSKLYLSTFSLDNMRRSCKEALSSLTDQIADNSDYNYSMVFIITCNGRHGMMGSIKTLESDIVKDKLGAFPPELNATGFYAFGEICPTGERADGGAKNRFHNISFALCAI